MTSSYSKYKVYYDPVFLIGIRISSALRDQNPTDNADPDPVARKRQKCLVPTTIPYVLKNFWVHTVFERKFTYPYKIEKIKYKTREKNAKFYIQCNRKAVSRSGMKVNS